MMGYKFYANKDTNAWNDGFLYKVTRLTWENDTGL